MPKPNAAKQDKSDSQLLGKQVHRRKSPVFTTSVLPLKSSTTTHKTRRTSESSLFDSAFLSLPRSKEPSIAPKKAVRVEPKSYFANERTFIQWSSAALWLLTVAALLQEQEAQNGITYLTKAGVALCAGALMLLVHAIYVYFKRIKLMKSGNANGYVDRCGPIVLFAVVFTGVLIILIEQSKSSFGTAQDTTVVVPTNVLHEAPSKCFLHSHHGISSLSYQPSDVIYDEQSGLLLTVSLTRVVGHSTTDFTGSIWDVVDIPGVDLEGLTMAEGRYFALAEPNIAMGDTENASLYELA